MPLDVRGLPRSGQDDVPIEPDEVLRLLASDRPSLTQDDDAARVTVIFPAIA